MAFLISLAFCVATSQAGPVEDQAAEIIEASGVGGGLIVHVGCGDGKVTAALRANDAYLVHGLDTSSANVAKARAHVRAAGLYGKASVDYWTSGRLPYVDNLVNLVVVEEGAKVAMPEVLRVLAPNGVACVKADNSFKSQN